MRLEALERLQMDKIRMERNQIVNDGILRTPYVLTHEMQNDWYNNVICNRDSTTRYWALWVENQFVGYGGIENIDWVNSHGEISLMIWEKFRGKGFGKEALRLFIDQAKNYMGLKTVYAEVYECNPNIEFWNRRNWSTRAYLQRRKLHKGQLYDSIIYTWFREDS